MFSSVNTAILFCNFAHTKCRFGFGFGGTGKKSNNRQFDDYGEAFGKNDVIACLIDVDNGEIKFLKNGEDLGTAFKINKQLSSAAFFPAVVLKVLLHIVTLIINVIKNLFLECRDVV